MKTIQHPNPPTSCEMVETILNTMNPPAGAAIRLAVFEDAAAHFFVLGDGGWSFEYHTIMIHTCARELTKRGFHVDLKTIFLDEYYDFLITNNEENTPESLATFVSH